MDAEQKAREVVDGWRSRHVTVITPPHELAYLAPLVAAAVREARAEALEDMASDVDGWRTDDYSAAGFARALRARAKEVRGG